MVDLNAINAILSTRNGVWATFLVVLLVAWRGWPHVPAIMAAWTARRQAIQAAKDADWTRIRDEAKHYADEAHRYADRLASVEQRHGKCEKDLQSEREARINAIAALNDALAGERAERMRLERLMLAEGEIRQSKAAVQAELRADPAKAPTTRERFGEGEGK